MNGLYPFTYVLPSFVLSSLKGLGWAFFYFLSALGTIRILAVHPVQELPLHYARAIECPLAESATAKDVNDEC